jgi:peptidoglycan/xylan/chitin deacetylase (PgdA/CDA1 family)
MKLLSLAGLGDRLSILIYHRVLPQPDPLFPEEVDAAFFDWQMALLASNFTLMPLADAIRSLREGDLPACAASITFDDGYADNAEVALPILQKYRIPATFFVSTRFLDGGRMWNDTVIELVRRSPGEILDLGSINLGKYDSATPVQRRKAVFSLLKQLKYLPLKERLLRVEEMCAALPVVLPDNLMMTSDQVRQLHEAGMEIGGHTVNHPILARLEEEQARDEIAAGKEALETIIRSPVRLFAYPNGKPDQDYHARHVRIVRDLGFEAAVSTAPGVARKGCDIFQLPRFTPWDRTKTGFMLHMAQNMLRTVQTV